MESRYIKPMKNIQMVDLKSQYLKIKTEINEGIQEVIDTTSFIKGGKVTNFQHQLKQASTQVKQQLRQWQ